MGEDNQSCLALVNNPEATGRTNHVDVAYHMVRDYKARGDVAFYFLPSAGMPADGLTKPLPSPAFTAFRWELSAYCSQEVEPISAKSMRSTWPFS